MDTGTARLNNLWAHETAGLSKDDILQICRDHQWASDFGAAKWDFFSELGSNAQWLTLDFVKTMSAAQFEILSFDAARALTAQQLNSIDSGVISRLGTYPGSFLCKLTANQICNLDPAAFFGFMSAAQLNIFNDTAIQKLTSAQIGAIATADLNASFLENLALSGTLQYLQSVKTTAEYINGLSARAIQSLSKKQIIAICEAHSGSRASASDFGSTKDGFITKLGVNAQWLTLGFIKTMSADQLNQKSVDGKSVLCNLSATQLQVLSMGIIYALKSESLSELSPSQLNAFSPSQISALSMAQINALSTQVLTQSAKYWDRMVELGRSADASDVYKSFSGHLSGAASGGLNRERYSLEITEGTMASVAINLQAGGFDTYLRVYKDGIIISSDDDSGTKLNSYVNKIWGPGKYLIEVAAYRDKGSGASRYKLDIDNRQITPLVLGQQLSSGLKNNGISSSDDLVQLAGQDIFALTIDKKSLITLHTKTSVVSGLDTILSIYKVPPGSALSMEIINSSNLVASQNNCASELASSLGLRASDSALVNQSLAAGNYLVVISSAGGQVGDYTLQFDSSRLVTDLSKLTPQEFGMLGALDISKVEDFSGISAAQAKYLTADMINALPSWRCNLLISSTVINSISSQARDALIGKLQLTTITRNQLELGVKVSIDINTRRLWTLLSGMQLSRLGTNFNGFIPSWTTSECANLNEDQVRGLSRQQFGQLTKAQVQAMKPVFTLDQLGYGINTGDFVLSVLTKSQVPLLSDAIWRGMTAGQIQCIGSKAPDDSKKTSPIDSVSNLSYYQLCLTTSENGSTVLGCLSGNQISQLQPSVIKLLNSSQLSSLGPSQVSGLTINQLWSLDPGQIKLIRADGFTAYQLESNPSAIYSRVTGHYISGKFLYEILDPVQLSQLSQQANNSSLVQIYKASILNEAWFKGAKLTDIQKLYVEGLRPDQLKVKNKISNQFIIAALTRDQFQRLDIRQNLDDDLMAYVAASRASWLSVHQVRSLIPKDLNKFNQNGVSQLDAMGLTEDQFGYNIGGNKSLYLVDCLSLDQTSKIALDVMWLIGVPVLNRLKISALTIEQMGMISADKFSQLTKSQVISLSRETIGKMTDKQVTALNADHLSNVQLVYVTRDGHSALSSLLRKVSPTRLAELAPFIDSSNQDLLLPLVRNIFSASSGATDQIVVTAPLDLTPHLGDASSGLSDDELATFEQLAKGAGYSSIDECLSDWLPPEKDAPVSITKPYQAFDKIAPADRKALSLRISTIYTSALIKQTRIALSKKNPFSTKEFIGLNSRDLNESTPYRTMRAKLALFSLVVDVTASDGGSRTRIVSDSAQIIAYYRDVYRLAATNLSSLEAAIAGSIKTLEAYSKQGDAMRAASEAQMTRLKSEQSLLKRRKLELDKKKMGLSLLKNGCDLASITLAAFAVNGAKTQLDKAIQGLNLTTALSYGIWSAVDSLIDLNNVRKFELFTKNNGSWLTNARYFRKTLQAGMCVTILGGLALDIYSITQENMSTKDRVLASLSAAASLLALAGPAGLASSLALSLILSVFMDDFNNGSIGALMPIGERLLQIHKNFNNVLSNPGAVGDNIFGFLDQNATPEGYISLGEYAWNLYTRTADEEPIAKALYAVALTNIHDSSQMVDPNAAPEKTLWDIARLWDIASPSAQVANILHQYFYTCRIDDYKAAMDTYRQNIGRVNFTFYTGAISKFTALGYANDNYRILEERKYSNEVIDYANDVFEEAMFNNTFIAVPDAVLNAGDNNVATGTFYISPTTSLINLSGSGHDKFAVQYLANNILGERSDFSDTDRPKFDVIVGSGIDQISSLSYSDDVQRNYIISNKLVINDPLANIIFNYKDMNYNLDDIAGATFGNSERQLSYLFNHAGVSLDTHMVYTSNLQNSSLYTRLSGDKYKINADLADTSSVINIKNYDDVILAKSSMTEVCIDTTSSHPVLDIKNSAQYITFTNGNVNQASERDAASINADYISLIVSDVFNFNFNLRRTWQGYDLTYANPTPTNTTRTIHIVDPGLTEGDDNFAIKIQDSSTYYQIQMMNAYSSSVLLPDNDGGEGVYIERADSSIFKIADKLISTMAAVADGRSTSLSAYLTDQTTPPPTVLRPFTP